MKVFNLFLSRYPPDKALKQLQPYILETRRDHRLVRGLRLAEMEHILAAQ